MNIYLRTCLIGMVVMVLTGASFAQKDKTDTKPKAQTKTASKPKAKPAPKVKPMVVTVKEVSGTAHRLLAGKDKKWAPLKVGDKIDEMTIIRTGFRTKVVLTFADGTLDDHARAPVFEARITLGSVAPTIVRAHEAEQVLVDRPRVGQQRPQARQRDRPVRRDVVPDRMLHPRVRDDYEVGGQPGSNKHHDGREPVTLGAQLLLTKEKQTQER